MLRIRGGKVYDPANQLNGEVRDVCIFGGRIAAEDRWRYDRLDGSEANLPFDSDHPSHFGVAA